MDEPDKPEPASRRLQPELLELVPKLLWFLLAVVVLLASYGPLLERVKAGDVSKVSFAAFQIEFARQDFQRAATRVRDNRPPTELAAYADRIESAGEKLIGAKALWVTEQDALRYLPERRALSSLGISFDLVSTNQQARDLLDATKRMGVPYDFVITDIHRPADTLTGPCFPSVPDSPQEAGCATVPLVRGYYPERPIPVIVYSGEAANGLPPNTLGGTAYFDELVSLVLDAVERRVTRAAQPGSKDGGSNQAEAPRS
ncbi:MAG: hypothetical protein ACJ8E3_09615 [Sphingomicrobium sp.]